MSRHMLEAEQFQEGLSGPASVVALGDDYAVPYRSSGEQLTIAVFTKDGRADYLYSDFEKEYPTEAGLEFWGALAPKKSDRQVVYFIGDGDAVKIGISIDPQRRLKQLQTSHPRNLSILGIVPGGATMEMELHGRFNNHHLRGEWYSDCQPIRDFVAANCNNTVMAA